MPTAVMEGFLWMLPERVGMGGKGDRFLGKSCEIFPSPSLRGREQKELDEKARKKIILFLYIYIYFFSPLIWGRL